MYQKATRQEYGRYICRMAQMGVIYKKAGT